VQWSVVNDLPMVALFDVQTQGLHDNFVDNVALDILLTWATAASHKRSSAHMLLFVSVFSITSHHFKPSVSTFADALSNVGHYLQSLTMFTSALSSVARGRITWWKTEVSDYARTRHILPESNYVVQQIYSALDISLRQNCLLMSGRTTRKCMHLVTRVHFRLRDKDSGYTMRYAVPAIPLLHINSTALCLIERELLPIKVLHREMFDLFGSCDLDLDTMTIYELDP